MNTMKQIDAIEKDDLVIGLAGDSGDGIQLIGLQLTYSAGAAGKHVNALPDYPAEVRAPAGTLSGVSSYTLKVSRQKHHTSGDSIDVLFAMNPAALHAIANKLSTRALIIINSDTFNSAGFKKADLAPTYSVAAQFLGCTIYEVPVSTLTKLAIDDEGFKQSDVLKSKNMFALGIMTWVIDLDPQVVIAQIEQKFSHANHISKKNTDIFHAGMHYAETTELFQQRFHINHDEQQQKESHRLVSGNSAFAEACLAAYIKSEGKVFVAGYPITPASSLLHQIASYQSAYGLGVFQAEDEISAACAAIGAAYGGFLSLTITSGPGFDLKTEALGLAVIAELPLVLINVQRAGPSTGMPTKTEQSDLLAAAYGRHGDAPIPILAPRTPADCFEVLIQAFTLAMRYMTPVIILSDASLANAVENMPPKKLRELPELKPCYPTDATNYQTYARTNADLARAWAVPGMPGFEHCLGGLEKAEHTGQVSYDGDNHQRMVNLRQEKIRRIALPVADEYFVGESTGELLLIGWGSTFGAIEACHQQLHAQGFAIAMLHIKQLFPLPCDLDAGLRRFNHVVVIEQNAGQLATLIRDKTLCPIKQYNVIDGQPLRSAKLYRYLLAYLQKELA